MHITKPRVLFLMVYRFNNILISLCMPAVCRVGTLQRTHTQNSKQIFPEKEVLGHSPNFHIHLSVSDAYISTIDLPILLQEICGPIVGIYKSLPDT